MNRLLLTAGEDQQRAHICGRWSSPGSTDTVLHPVAVTATAIAFA